LRPARNRRTSPTAEEADPRLWWFPADVGCHPRMVDPPTALARDVDNGDLTRKPEMA
jgi:hypothetical protein